MANYEGPLVHVDWQLRPDEWEDLKMILLANRTPFVDQLVANGALA